MEITFLELKTVLTKWIGSLQDSRFTVYLYPAVIFVDRSLLARLLGCVWFARSGSGFQAFGFFRALGFLGFSGLSGLLGQKDGFYISYLILFGILSSV